MLFSHLSRCSSRSRVLHYNPPDAASTCGEELVIQRLPSGHISLQTRQTRPGPPPRIQDCSICGCGLDVGVVSPLTSVCVSQGLDGSPYSRFEDIVKQFQKVVSFYFSCVGGPLEIPIPLRTTRLWRITSLISRYIQYLHCNCQSLFLSFSVSLIAPVSPSV